jgi:hypothetical protein
MESMETNSKVRVGVVTTLKGVEDSLLSFLLYHLAIGVSKIYLFFDDPSDAAIPIALDVKDERVRPVSATRCFIGFPLTFYLRLLLSNTTMSLKVNGNRCLCIQVRIQTARSCNTILNTYAIIERNVRVRRSRGTSEAVTQRRTRCANLKFPRISLTSHQNFPTDQ